MDTVSTGLDEQGLLTAKGHTVAHIQVTPAEAKH
jgi:hypothetical protein